MRVAAPFNSGGAGNTQPESVSLFRVAGPRAQPYLPGEGTPRLRDLLPIFFVLLLLLELGLSWLLWLPTAALSVTCLSKPLRMLSYSLPL